MAQIGWRELQGLCRDIPDVVIRESDKEIILPGGGSVKVKSADGGIRGEGLDFVVLDEVAFTDPDLWRYEVRPMLADRKGRALFISTPNALNHFHDTYQQALDDKSGEWAAFHFPTSSNPFVPPEEIEAAKRSMSELAFRQEFMAEFVAPGACIFDRRWWQYYDSLPDRYRIKVQSWDTAFKTHDKADYSACVTAMQTDDCLYLTDVWRGQVDFPTLKETAKSLWEQHVPEIILIEDKASGQSLIQELDRGLHLPVFPVKCDKDKIARANAASVLVREGKVKLPRGAAWVSSFVSELERFGIEDDSLKDDQVDAFSHLVNYLQHTDVVKPVRTLPALLGGPCDDLLPTYKPENEYDGLGNPYAEVSECYL
jgi:predicted phage terminase large subunit-like protein